jgi:FKBP-type peptidyl-prolyl cis-trans isomerase
MRDVNVTIHYTGKLKNGKVKFTRTQDTIPSQRALFTIRVRG